MRLIIAVVALASLTARAELFPSSSISTSAAVERVSREERGTENLTTRQVKVNVRNTSPQSARTVGIECVMFYRDLRTDHLGEQHRQRTSVTLASGEEREIIADKTLFRYTPDQFRAFGHGRHNLVRHIPGSGPKYFGYVVRVWENGEITNVITSSDRLPSLVGQSPSPYYSSASRAVTFLPHKR